MRFHLFLSMQSEEEQSSAVHPELETNRPEFDVYQLCRQGEQHVYPLAMKNATVQSVSNSSP